MEGPLYYTLFILGLINIVIIAGIVWRVEKLLDISYKFLMSAVIVFTLGVVLQILAYENIIPTIAWGYYRDFFFILLFTIAMFEMRLLVRRLDGEVKSKKKQRT